jgi:geranylgeranyl pyrophosphate synthase/intein/homing endonuclease
MGDPTMENEANIKEKLKRFAPIIDAEISKVIPKQYELPNLYDAMWYFLRTGGKRWRPALCLAVCEALGGKKEEALPFATSIELVHEFCLTGESKLLTNPGKPKRIDEIKVGDVVYSLDMKTKKIKKAEVLGIRKNGMRDVYEFKTNNRTIHATSNHPFLVASKRHSNKLRLTRKGIKRIHEAKKRKGTTFVEIKRKLGLPPGSRNWWSGQPRNLIPRKTLEKIYDLLDLELENDDYTEHIARTPALPVFEWKPLKEVGKGDLIVICKGIPDEGKSKGIPKPKITNMMNHKDSLILPEKTDERFCQIVGLFLGDGSIKITEKEATLTFSIPETDLVRENYKRVFQEVFKKRLKGDKDNLVCCSRKLCLVFDKLGLNRNALEKFLPDWVYELPRSQKLALVRGYIDSDGTVNKRGRVVFGSASKKLIDDLKALLDSLGFRTSNVRSKIVDNTHFERYVKRRKSKIWELGLGNPKKILKEIGTENQFYSKRLKNRREGKGFKHETDVPNNPLDRRFFGLNRVKSVEKVGKDYVYDMEVDGSHNFVANGIVVHNSLIHDDIEDGDEFRRDQPTVWKKYGVPHAINIGDGMFIKIYESALKSRKYLSEEKVNQLVSLLTDTMLKIVEGQTMDMNFRERDDVTEKEYMEMVWRKTGVLIGATVTGGALIAGADKEMQQALMEYGKEIGPAFQIQDDLIDIDPKAWKGRKGEIGCDIREGKRTLIVIHCLNHATKEDRELLLQVLNKKRGTKTKEDVEGAIKILKRSGSVDYTKRVTERLAKEAKKYLEIIPPEKRKFLEEFTDFLIERKF